jgi:hypothetical protein
MLVAVWSMARINKKTKRPELTARQFEIARASCAEAASMYRHTEESKDKIRKALTGKPKSESHKRNTGLSSKGRTWKVAECANPKLNQGSKNPRAKTWEVLTPNGIIKTDCLRLWCLENSVCESYLKKKSRLKQDHRGVMILNY